MKFNQLKRDCYKCENEYWPIFKTSITDIDVDMASNHLRLSESYIGIGTKKLISNFKVEKQFLYKIRLELKNI